jgi:hypothetical protein
MGVDITYVSDYIDNHQQMQSDLKENEIEFEKLKRLSENLLRTCKSEEQTSDIKRSMELIDSKWTKLRRSVEHRILVAIDYLEFVKTLNQFRNLALDLQELFKTFTDYNLIISSSSNDSQSVFEKHVQEKMQLFETVHNELKKKGQQMISTLKKVFILRPCLTSFDCFTFIFTFKIDR